MSRLVLFIVFVIWEMGGERSRPTPPHAGDLAIFFGGFALLVGSLGVMGYTTRRGRQAMFLWAVWVGRQLVAVWFAVGVFLLHWHDTVDWWLRSIAPSNGTGYRPESIPAFVGTLPAIASWVAILIARYPGERAIREELILDRLDDNLPVHSPGGLRSFLSAHLRLDLLFILVPIGLIMVLRDAGLLAITQAYLHSPMPTWIEPTVSLVSAGLVFLMAPVLLSRLLRTRPLPPSPLRTRLEFMCQKAGLRYRQILLWHTNHHMGNAAVMGVLPQVRYILLSDLLLETMSDEQIEAVFAHELGHVVHRHLTWMGICIVVLMLAVIGPGEWVDRMTASHLPSWLADVVMPAIEGIGALLLLFGGLSRSFERQADVYAARTIEDHHRANPAVAGPLSVGTYGANLFGSALHRVAAINGIPIYSRNLSHGSIANRIDYLHELSGDPARTNRFDRTMRWIYFAVIALLISCGVWAAIVLVRE